MAGGGNVAACALCGRKSSEISEALGLCAGCILADTEAARARAGEAHRRSRVRFGLPGGPPRDEDGVRCTRCANTCRVAPYNMGYCGVRRNREGRIAGGDSEAAAVSWYHDPLPTNCVADWVCPASTAAGYPQFTDSEGAETGHTNLAVFYEACSFDCLFCQNWHFRARSVEGPRRSAVELAEAVDEHTRCICFFGGDPTCQVEHALTAARLARERRSDDILRVCWETNGSVSRSYLRTMAQVSLESGGCIKFDLKAWDESLHRALCGVSNKATLANFEYLAKWTARRLDPPFLVASTLMVPGYVGAEQVGEIARFVSRLSPDIPYALLGFHPQFEMGDLPATSRDEARRCLAAAKSEGLTRVRLGNVHLLC